MGKHNGPDAKDDKPETRGLPKHGRPFVDPMRQCPIAGHNHTAAQCKGRDQ